jgi:hypothetical protein
MDPTTWFGAEAYGRILAILGQLPTEAIAISAFERLAHTLVTWWDADDHQHKNQHQGHLKRNIQTELTLTNLLENFLLHTTTRGAIRVIKPIVDAVNRHPNKAHWLLLGLIDVVNRQPNTQQFWLLWDQFADEVRRAMWLARIDSERAEGREMISAIFFVTSWKKEIRHWWGLDGFAGHVHALFDDLPASSTVLDNYLRFLYNIGERSLPEAFLRSPAKITCLFTILARGYNSTPREICLA